jgi:hypothetical protein
VVAHDHHSSFLESVDQVARCGIHSFVHVFDRSREMMITIAELPEEMLCSIDMRPNDLNAIRLCPADGPYQSLGLNF